MFVLLVNDNQGDTSTHATSFWLCRLCGANHIGQPFLRLFSSNGEHPYVSYIRRYLDIKVEECDKISLSVCQLCVSKLEDMQRFYEASQETQKFLTQQGNQFNGEVLREDGSTTRTNSSIQQSELAVQVTNFIQNKAPSNEDIPIPSLTANKLLETAIKDTCILSEDDSDVLDDHPEDQAEFSGEFMSDVSGGETRSSVFARKSEPPLPKKRKKLVFTLEYLESKLNRKLDDDESKRLKEYIQKGQNTKIFEMLVGGGKDQLWKCQYCTEDIQGSPKDVKDHYASFHQAPPIFPCQLCDKVCRSVNYYRIHRLSHLAEYPCEVCGKVFKDNSKLVLHKQVHSNKRPHECDICGKTFKRATTVRVHKRTVHGTKDEQFLFTCELCGKRFKTNFELKKHLDKHPSEDNPLPYQCKYCDSRFPDKAQQITHSNTFHANEGEYVCHICGKKVKTETALENHVKSHSGIRDLKCNICDATFASRYTLNAHVKRHAITEPLFSCPYCGKGSKSKANLEQHIRIHTGVRPYSCNVCNAAFKHRSHLKVHMTIHTGEHPFACHECNKTFRTNKQRTSHMSYVHNTARNFVCETCNKAFKTIKDLKIHSTLHTGEKPNICQDCGKAFRVRANYFKHRKIHQRGNSESKAENDSGISKRMEGIDLTTKQQDCINLTAVSINVEQQNPGLLETYQIDTNAQIPQISSSTITSVRDEMATHGTSTISDEGVLLFRTALSTISSV